MYRNPALSVRFVVALLVLLLFGGCLGSVPANTDGTTTSTSTIASPTDCGDAWVSFYGVGTEVQDRLWDADAVSLGYTLPGGKGFLLVAYENGTYRNGTLLGTEHVEFDTGYGVTADGDTLTLDSALVGNHTVSVVIHRDENGNDEFDRAVDGACRNDGQIVTTGPETLNFSAFGNETTEG